MKNEWRQIAQQIANERAEQIRREAEAKKLNPTKEQMRVAVHRFADTVLIPVCNEFLSLFSQEFRAPNNCIDFHWVHDLFCYGKFYLDGDVHAEAIIRDDFRIYLLIHHTVSQRTVQESHSFALDFNEDEADQIVGQFLCKLCLKHRVPNN